MLAIYTLVLYLVLPLVLCRLAWLGFGNRAYLKRWPERFGFVSPAGLTPPVIWIHAVSVGEVQAAGPLVDRILESKRGGSVLITTTTPGGAETAERRFGPAVEQRYFPYDLPGPMRRFLDRVEPRLLVVMETEIWPNLYHQCRRRNIPVVLANARLSEASRRGYARFHRLIAQTLQCLSLIAAQTREDAERFRSLGAAAGTITVTGNLKFDIAQPYSIVEAGAARRRFFHSDRPVWIAASTHEGEEKQVLDAFHRVLERHADCLLVIAPRHPQRSDEIVELCRRYGFQTGRHTCSRDYSRQTRVYIVDTLGELPIFYAAADVAFVGGSLVPHGGHNMLEPASLGVPVLTGPCLQNFAEISQLLAREDALEKVSTVQELAGKVCQLLDNADLRQAMGERGRRVVQENQGALGRLTDALDPFF